MTTLADYSIQIVEVERKVRTNQSEVTEKTKFHRGTANFGNPSESAQIQSVRLQSSRKVVVEEPAPFSRRSIKAPSAYPQHTFSK